MKFTIERAGLLDALAHAARVAPRGDTIPILGHVLVEAAAGAVVLTATDMNRWLSVQAEAVTVAKKGRTTANAANLLAFVRATPDGSQVEAELAKERLVLRAGRARASLPTLPDTDFPVRKDEDYAATLEIAGEALAKALGRVAHAQSNETTRFYLNGVFLHAQDGGLRVCATDGHRLAWSALAAEGKVPADLPGIIVPREAIGDLQALADDADEPLVLEISTAGLRVSRPGVKLTTRLVDGVFPEYSRVIPSDNECGFQAARAALASAVARCGAFTSKEERGVKMTVAKGVVQLSRRGKDAGDIKDEIDARLRDRPGETGFNSAYMGHALAALDSDTVDLEFTPGGPILIRDPADRDAQVQVVMSMRV